MLFKEKSKKKKLIIPEIPKGYKAHPFLAGDDFDMPENLLGILNNNGFDINEYKCSFVIPPQAYLRNWFGKRFVPWQALLFNDKTIVHVKDSLFQDESGTVSEVSADNLAYLNLNHCLLYGKLNIVCSNGQDKTLTEVEYNTTSYRLLEPNLQRFLRASWHESKLSDDDEDVYERLKNIPVKYRNGVFIYVLQKDEILLDFIYLPRFNRKLGFIKINLIPHTLFAVTDRQLVILQDDLSHTSSYTWILTYIPRNNVKGVSLEKQKNSFTKVIIKIKRNNLLEELSAIIEDRYADDVKALLSALIK